MSTPVTTKEQRKAIDYLIMQAAPTTTIVETCGVSRPYVIDRRRRLNERHARRFVKLLAKQLEGETQ